MIAGRSNFARWSAIGGVVGPAGFIGAWLAGAVTAENLSPIDDAISRLAAVGAETRPLMTTGLVVFGVAMPVYALSLRRFVRGPAWVAAMATGLSTLGVAFAPLDRSRATDAVHGVFAGLGYITLAATPLLACHALGRAGQRRLADAGLVAGAISAASLALSLGGRAPGLFQRIGLTAGDVWVVASALTILRGRLLAPAAMPTSSAS